MSPASFGRRAAATLALLSAALLGACGGADANAPAPVAHVALSGASDTLTVGDRRTLAAALSDAHGTTLAGRTVTWTSSDNSIATVDASGVLTAVAPGRLTVTATSEGVSGQLTLTVRRRPVASVSLDRPVDTLWLGRTHTLRAQPRDVNGTALGDRAITWSASDSSVVAVSALADGTAIVRGVQLGATSVVANSEGVSSTIPVVVVPVPVARVSIAAADTVILGRTATLTASATAPDGTPVALADLVGRAVTWTSDRSGVVSVAGAGGFAGAATGVTAGSATITATIDGASARVTLLAARAAVARVAFASATTVIQPGASTTIVADPRDASGQAVAGAPMVYTLASGAGVVKLTPATAPNGEAGVRIDALSVGTATVAVAVDGQSATLAVTVSTSGATLRAYPTSITARPGARGRLSAALVDAAGQSQTPNAVTWTSLNPAVATVDATGRVTMGSPGTTTIRATAGGTTASVAVTVTPAPTSAFHIEVIPVGVVPQAVIDAANQAAVRWERVITTAGAPQQATLRPGECDVGMPAINRMVTNIVVFLNVDNIDGGGRVLAWAGPCLLRDATVGGLPLVGAMTVDNADVAMLTGSSNSLALDVLTHELGHVLGIGIPEVWNGTPAGRLLQGTGVDIRFTGASATMASMRMGVTSSVAEGVPVEDQGGSGTAGGHWRERVFLGELMTGYVGTAPNPLSIVTVQSLSDLGYQVTETGADIVSPASLTGGTALYSRAPLPGATTGMLELIDRLRRPKLVAGPKGTRPIGAQERQ